MAIDERAVFLVGDLRNAMRNDAGQLTEQADWHLCRTNIRNATARLLRASDPTLVLWVKRVWSMDFGNEPRNSAQDTMTQDEVIELIRYFLPEYAQHAYLIGGDRWQQLWDTFPAKQA